jgi:excisionase family DNA binding protein
MRHSNSIQLDPPGEVPFFYSINDICARFALSRPTVYALLHTGRLEAVKLGRRTFITSASVQGFVAGLPRFEAPAGPRCTALDAA